MSKRITPCLWFNNQAKEAAELYLSAFAKSKITSQSPMVSEVEISGQKFILLDGGPMYKPNPSISFYYTCNDQQEFDHAWNALQQSGTVLMPANKYPWSEKYGWLADRFGISWQLSVGKLPESGEKIVPCFLFTGKQYGKVDEAIEHYSSVFKTVDVENIIRYGSNELPDKEGKVKLARVAINGQDFMMMESAADHKFTFSEGVSLTIYCESQSEIDYYWEKFTEEGEESMCGWLKDQFGVSWQIIPTMLGKILSDPSRAGKAAKAFMSMRKLNIEQIVQASI